MCVRPKNPENEARGWMGAASCRDMALRARALRAGLYAKRGRQISVADREAGPVLSAPDRPVGRAGGALGVLSVLGVLDVRRSSTLKFPTLKFQSLKFLSFEVSEFEVSIFEVSKFEVSKFKGSKVPKVQRFEVQNLTVRSLKFQKFQHLKCEVS